MTKQKKKKSLMGFYGDCYYCRKMNDELRTVKFKVSNIWQKDKRDICPDCRRYLQGQFKYV